MPRLLGPTLRSLFSAVTTSPGWFIVRYTADGTEYGANTPATVSRNWSVASSTLSGQSASTTGSPAGAASTHGRIAARYSWATLPAACHAGYAVSNTESRTTAVPNTATPATDTPSNARAALRRTPAVPTQAGSAARRPPHADADPSRMPAL